MVRCGNGVDGCGGEFRVKKTNQAGQVEAENYNPACRLCLPCCNKLAYDWQISFEDVDFLMTAKHNARAGKMGEPGTKEEVYELLARMGVKRKARPDYTRPPPSVPVGDRS